MTLEEVIIELYRLGETKSWDGKRTDEALAIAIEGLEHIWSLKRADIRKRGTAVHGGKRQPRVWS